MADREKVERVVVIDQAEKARLAAEERLRAEEAGEVTQLDKATVPGGVYQWPDGRFHDAEGYETDENGKRIKDAAPEPANLHELLEEEVEEEDETGTKRKVKKSTRGKK